MKYKVLFVGFLLLAGCGQGMQSKPGMKVVNPIEGADPMVPFAEYLRQPAYAAPKISPDGKHIVVYSEYQGVLNLMFASVTQPAELKPLTRDTGRGFQTLTIWSEPTVRWLPNNTHIVYMRDDKGDENWTLYSLNINSGESQSLTPLEGVVARDLKISPQFPDEVFFWMNDKGPGERDYYRVNVVTGALTHVTSARPFYAKVFDHEFQERLAVEIIDGTDLNYYSKLAGAKLEDAKVEGSKVEAAWKPIASTSLKAIEAAKNGFFNDYRDSLFGPDPRYLYAFSSDGYDTSVITLLDTQTGQRELVAQEPGVDIKQALMHPRTGELQAYVRHFTLKEWVVVDPELRQDFDFLRQQGDGEIGIESRSYDNRIWAVSYTRSNHPTEYFLYRRGSAALTALGVSNPGMTDLKLSDMFPIVTQSSDGFDLVSYIAYPTWVPLDSKNKPKQPVPTVVVIHGGPSDERATYGFSPIVQWFTNRGYAVFLVNFRGSPGFGKAFMQAQRGEWGGKMHRDVVEQVNYLVAQGIADGERLGVMGGSYGGFATLIAMTKTPDLFACGVSLVGPSNLVTFLNPESIPPDWVYEDLIANVGDPRTEAGRKSLMARSPITYAHQTKGKVLVAQGANDVRVPTRESDQIVAAMAEANVDVTYLLYPDEGHGIIRNENFFSFLAIAEVFFGECLDGRYQPLTDQLQGSSVIVPTGVDKIPGLAEALNG